MSITPSTAGAAAFAVSAIFRTLVYAAGERFVLSQLFRRTLVNGARRLLRRSRSKRAAASPPPFHFALQDETRAQPHYPPDSGVLLVGDKAKKLKAASARAEESARFAKGAKPLQQRALRLLRCLRFFRLWFTPQGREAAFSTVRLAMLAALYRYSPVGDLDSALSGRGGVSVVCYQHYCFPAGIFIVEQFHYPTSGTAVEAAARLVG